MRQTRSDRDAGFTLIEVMVALLVFAIISSGIVAGATAIVGLTADNRARITAANLASQELDTVRAITDTYSIESAPTRDIPVDGRMYHLTRTVSWVSSSGLSITCNSSTNLFFLRVNVRVVWDGMSGIDTGVQDDTVLAPAEGGADSTLGAIGVFVKTSAGDPVTGVTVSITAPSGYTGQAPAAQPKPTTADGCTYANGMKPGTYMVKVSKTGYRAIDGNTAPTRDVAVSAGGTASVEFVLDPAASANVNFSFGPQSVSQTPSVPSNLPINYTANGMTYTTQNLLARLFPSSSVYTVTAGPARCASIDPQAWLAASVNGVSLQAGVTATAQTVANTTTNVTVPLGAVLVQAPAGSTLTATQAVAEGDGNPGCGSTGANLTWSVKGTGSWIALALPYGSWTISANGVPLAPGAEQVLTNTALVGVSTDGTVTLDPRKATKP